MGIDFRRPRLLFTLQVVSLSTRGVQLMAKEDLTPLVVQILRHRARERLIPVKADRIIKVYPSLPKGGDYQINRFEIRIAKSFVLKYENPFDMIDHVLTAVAAFDMIAVHEQAQRITRVKSEIMKWSAYLERALPHEAYADFIHSLNHKEP
jgi:hypothetical protein